MQAPIAYLLFLKRPTLLYYHVTKVHSHILNVYAASTAVNINVREEWFLFLCFV